jgi:hypothetical protein
MMTAILPRKTTTMAAAAPTNQSTKAGSLFERSFPRCLHHGYDWFHISEEESHESTQDMADAQHERIAKSKGKRLLFQRPHSDSSDVISAWLMKPNSNGAGSGIMDDDKPSQAY